MPFATLGLVGANILFVQVTDDTSTLVTKHVFDIAGMGHQQSDL